jgi:hypothetical protein
LNRKNWNEVCDDNFLRRRLIGKYPGIDQYKYENETETWKSFFLLRNWILRTIYYISKMQEIYAFSDQALKLSSENGHINIVKYLVQHGANTHVHGNFALRLEKYGHKDIAEYLRNL